MRVNRSFVLRGSHAGAMELHLLCIVSGVRNGMRIRRIHFFLACSALFASSVADTASQTSPQGPRPEPSVAATPAPVTPVAAHAEPVVPAKAFVDTYCVTCHNQ